MLKRNDHRRSIGGNTTQERAIRWLVLLATAFGVALAGPARSADIVEYYELDNVGNVLVVEDADGNIVEEHDYLPFGEEVCGTVLCSSVTPGQPLRFTSKERDSETAFDYLGARYYASGIGQFTTVDPAMDLKATLVNPQKWNKYAYALNNPLRYVDPDGRQEFEASYAIADQLSQMSPRERAFIERKMVAEGKGAAVPGALAVAALGVVWAPALWMEGQIALGLLGPPVGQMIAGNYGQVSRSELEAASRAGGPTIEVLTRQAAAPAAGRALSVAAGEGAEALTTAARSGGTLYSGAIPRALMSAMEKAGLVQVSTTAMKGGAQATEYRFLPQATEFVTSFFREKQ